MPKCLLFYLFTLAAVPLFAQQGIPQAVPVNAQTVDMFSWVTKELDRFMAVGGAVFVPLAQQWLAYLGTAVLVFVGIDMAFTGSAHTSGAGLRKFLFTYAISYLILEFYNTPFPGIGLNFHEIFMTEARYLAATIDIDGLDLVLSKFSNIFIHMEHPGLFDTQAIGVYFIVLAEMAIFSIAVFVIIAQSFIYLGMAILLFPLTVPFRGVPHADNYFWSALNCIIKYALMRVAASALIFIFGGIILQYIDLNLNGPAADYSLAHFTVMLPAMSVIMISGALCIFGVKHFVSDFTAGGASATGSGSGVVMSVARMII
jgi:hypothetical protein